MLPRVMVLRPDHDAAFESLWRAADEQRRRELDISARLPPAPSPSTVTAFGVGVFAGEALVAGAVAVPARADDGGSQRVIAGLAHIS
ncbi:MAG: hypothetical protein M3423_06370, partial [Actinomycetota bacterium]|nr:hypothetical protein [Actinomycetota bacterium]